MKYFIPLFFISLLLSVTPGYGQSYNKKQNYVWAFTKDMKLDFNGISPVASPTTIQSSNDANASVCDANGHLLFYTDGDYFYDKNNNIMPHGLDVTGLAYTSFGFPFSPTVNSSHGAQIIPVPGSPYKYFVFTVIGTFVDGLTPIIPLQYGYMYYTVVDMTLNGGSGDVDTMQRGIFFDQGFTTSIAGVAGNNCDYWLVAHTLDSNIFKAYDITSTGIDHTPVVSQTGLLLPYNAYGNYYDITISPNRSKIVLGSDSTEVFDLNPTTGTVSNDLLLGVSSDDAAFSLDDTKLYTKVSGNPIYQFDLSSNTPTAFTAVSPTLDWLGLRLGPDGKIYTCGPRSANEGIYNIGCINNPNLAGVACGFDSLAITWIGGYMESYFPNEVPVLTPDSTGTKQQMILCSYSTLRLEATDTTADSYLWQDGATGNARVINTPGTYIVSYNMYGQCRYHSDTFLVLPVGNITPDLGDDTTICGISCRLQASISGVTYLWQDGSTDSIYNADSTGTYWVQVSKDGCIAADTINIRFINLQQDIGLDTIFCIGEPFQIKLSANVPSGAIALWSTGSNLPAITVNDTGTYWVSVSYTPSSCENSDTMRVASELCNCHVEMPNAFTPNGDDKNDLFRPVIQPGCQIWGYLFTIYNRWGQMVFSSATPGQGWDGTLHGIPENIGTYMYVIQLEAGTKGNKFSQHGDVELVR